jgi:hypothetical protein
MISTLIVTAALISQAAEPKPAEPPAPAQPVPATPARKAEDQIKAQLKKAQAKPQTKTEAEAQAKSVVAARRARKVASNKRQAIRNAQDAADYEKALEANKKAVKAQEDYIVKMGPIWAAQNANAIQQQRNAIMAESNRIAKQKADYDAWIQWQLVNSINSSRP